MVSRNDGKVYLTPKGKKKLQDELYNLKTVKQDEITEFMQSIMEEGDISENSGYDDARAKQGALDSRINELEDLLGKAVVVEESALAVPEVVGIGSTVVLENATGTAMTLVIVGTHEVDTLKRQISDESPMGKAILGRRVGETVSVPGRGGKTSNDYTVREIRTE